MTAAIDRLSLEDFKMGVLGASVSIPAGFLTMKASQKLLENWALDVKLSQSFFPVFEILSKVSHSLLRGVLKVFVVVYVVALVPLAEEWLFRGQIFEWQKMEAAKSEALSSRLYRVIANGIVFGAFHSSFLLGWATVPIFTISTISGIVFATLREKTGKLWAPTLSHSMNNAIVLLMIYLNIL